MTFTTPEILLILGAIFAGIVSVINALKNRRIEDGIEVVKRTSAVIEGHVNSAATAARMRDEAATREINTLTATIADLKATAIALAAAMPQASSKGPETL